MQLVDAIEAWGGHIALPSTEARLMPSLVWRTVRASEHASLDVATMTKDEARAVMSVFAAEDRSSVASTLNKVRKWTIAQAAEAEAEPVVEVDAAPEPDGDGDVATAGAEDAASALRSEAVPEPTSTAGDLGRAPDPDVESVRLGPSDTRETVAIDGSAIAPSARETLPVSGPVEGWEPPSPVNDPPAAIDQRIILGLIGLVLAVLLVWFLFLRGDDGEAPDPVNTGPQTVEDVIDRTNEAFLDQFELSPEVGECLVGEFGDLASAATDATLREREVCGTSLLALITDAS